MRRIALALLVLLALEVEAGAVTRTICASGCTYTTPAACVAGSSTNDWCRHDDSLIYSVSGLTKAISTFTYIVLDGQTPTLQCAAGNPCFYYHIAWAIRGSTVLGHRGLTMSGGAYGATNGGGATTSIAIYDVNFTSQTTTAVVVGGDATMNASLQRLRITACTGYCVQFSRAGTLLNSIIHDTSSDGVYHATIDLVNIYHNTFQGIASECVNVYQNDNVKYNLAYGCGGSGFKAGSANNANCAYNNVYSGSYSYCTGAGNTSSDPIFLNLGANDFHLTATSPNPAVVDGATGSSYTSDYDYATRGAARDKGAYEYIASGPQRRVEDGVLGKRVDDGVLQKRVKGGVL